MKIGVDRALGYAEQTGLPPLIVVPYLNDEALSTLEKQKVSCLDRSGNGLIFAPDFAVQRSGMPRKSPIIQPKLKIYSGNSSRFTRCFLLRPEYSSLSDLRHFALSRLSNVEQISSLAERSIMTLGTASKVVKELEEELLIKRDGKRLYVTDADRLMKNLLANHVSRRTTTILGKTSLSTDEVWQRLDQATSSEFVAHAALKYTATGLASAARYRALSGPDRLTIYVNDLNLVAALIDVSPTRVFPNIELVDNQSDLAYFDARQDGNKIWTSPIQTWLELASGGPREQEAAADLAVLLAQSRGEDL